MEKILSQNLLRVGKSKKKYTGFQAGEIKGNRPGVLLQDSSKVQVKQMIKICDLISKWAIYVLVFLMPLFFLPWTVDKLDFNKQALLLILVFISLFFWMIKILFESKISLNLAKFHISVGVLIFVALASTFFSLWRYGSFWGWPLVGSESLLSLICLVLFYFLVVNIFEKKEIYRLIVMLVISGFLSLIFFIFQFFAKFLLPLEITKSISFNTIGSLNMIGIFSAVLLPLVIGFFILAKKGILKIISLIVLLSIFLVLVLINFSVVWWLIVLAVLLIISLAIQKKSLFDNRFLVLPMIFLAFSLFFIFFDFKSPAVFSRPVEVYLTQKVSLDVAVETIKERPILGSGPGTFIYDFSKYKDVRFNNSPLWNVRFDASRSKMLGILGVLGILGLLGYLGIIGLFLFYGLKYILKKDDQDIEDDRKNKILVTIIFISFITLSLGYFLYNSNLTLDFLFFFLIASFIVLIMPEKKSWTLKPSSLITLMLSFIFTLIFIFGLGLFILEGQRYWAEIYYFKGIKAWQNGKTDASLNYLERAAKLNPKTDLYWRELSQIYLEKIQEEAVRRDISRPEINQRIQFLISNTVNSAKKASDINPNNVSNWSVRGFLYQNLIGVVGGVTDWSEKMYIQALELEPANAYYPTQIGISLLKDANLPNKGEGEKSESYKKAVEQFRKGIDLKSDYAPARFQLALAYQALGKTAEAIEELKKAKILNPYDIGLLFQLGLIYYQNNNYNLAENELSQAVLINPNYSNALYFLGLVYEKQGKKSQTIGVFERLKNLNPDNKEIKQILSNLKNDQKALYGIVEDVPPTVPIQEEPEEIE